MQQNLRPESLASPSQLMEETQYICEHAATEAKHGQSCPEDLLLPHNHTPTTQKHIATLKMDAQKAIYRNIQSGNYMTATQLQKPLYSTIF